MRITVCLWCAAPTLNGSCCPTCAGGRRAATRDRRYDDPAWRKLRNRTLAEHRATFGNWCPGYGRAGHATADLTTDHRVPMSHGGAITGPVQVLCRGCNTRKSHDDSPRARPWGASKSRRARRS